MGFLKDVSAHYRSLSQLWRNCNCISGKAPGDEVWTKLSLPSLLFPTLYRKYFPHTRHKYSQETAQKVNFGISVFYVLFAGTTFAFVNTKAFFRLSKTLNLYVDHIQPSKYLQANHIFQIGLATSKKMEPRKRHNFLVGTTLQSIMNAKLSKHGFWHCHENRHNKTIETNQDKP